MAVLKLFHMTIPIPRYRVYSLMSLTLKTVPYTKESSDMESKLDNPIQKLPNFVLTNLSLVLAFAEKKQTFLISHAFFKEK